MKKRGSLLNEGKTFVGVIPAAGVASRLAPLRYPKELLPIWLESNRECSAVRPSAVVEYSLKALRCAETDRAHIVISDSKTEILRYLQNGEEWGIHLSFVVQPKPVGLAEAVDELFPWISGPQDYTLLSLPDTVYSPMDALRIIKEAIITHDVDLVLGVFPTDTPQHFGPVQFRADGMVEAVYEKPATTDLLNTWGVAAWSPEFTNFLHQQLLRHRITSIRVSLGNIFNAACKNGLSVRAVYFSEGAYFDFGTCEGITRFTQQYVKGLRNEPPEAPIDRSF